MATALTSELTRFTDKCNNVLAGGVVKTFEPNSLTPKTSYQDPECTIPNFPEVNLDETGRARIYIQGDYRVQVYSRDGILIEDNLLVEQSLVQRDFVELSQSLQVEQQETLNQFQAKADDVIAKGFYTGYATETALKASLPTVSEMRARADDTRKIWRWNRTSAEGVTPVTGTWTDTGLSDLDQAISYSDQKIKTISIYKKIDAYVETVLDVNGFTRIKMQTKSGQTYFYDSRIAENDQSIADLNATVKGVEIYKKIKGQVVTILDAEGFTRIKEQNVTTGQFISYVGAKQKSLVAGTGISILETPETITIEAGAAAYATPYEYVLCLIAGQSNASYYGGDDALAPNLPNGVCYVWDNTYNTVREINDGSVASKTCKQTYGPAIALEFYKKTGMGLIIVNSAVGSTAQTAEADNGAGNWSPTGALRQTAVDRIVACRAYLDSISTCFQNGFIVWTQGERDGQEIQLGTITKAQYKTGLSEMIDFFKSNLGSKLPFILTATAYYTSTGDNTGSKSVRAAQYEITHEKAGAYMGFTGAVKFPSRNLLADGVHYNQAGKNILGTAVGRIAHILSAGVN